MIRFDFGTFSVKMKLHKDIPQFLPMHGKKIRIYYRNMTKLCTNCFGKHTRKQFRNQKIPWITYVRDFTEQNEHLDESYYGKWWKIVDEEYPGYFKNNDTSSNLNKDQAPEQRKEPQHSRATAESLNQKRQARDPRLNRERNQNNPQHQQQQISDEIAILMSKGLTLSDSQTYLNKKRDLERLKEVYT